MDPKGKGMVINKKKKKESLFNEPREDKLTDSGSSHMKKDGKKKRRIKKIIYYDSDASSSSPRMTTTTTPRPKIKRLIQITPFVIFTSITIQMLIYSLFHLENPHTLMERITHFGVIKCVVTYFPSILAFGKL
jgi:hypothetical protein